MVAYTFRMPAGIPGDVNRAEEAIIEPQVITPAGSANAPATFGTGIVIDATTGQVRLPVSADTGIYGFLVRPFPTQEGTQTPALGTGIVPSQGACDILKRGYMTVLLQNTTPAIKGGKVYVRTAAASGSLVLGGVEAAAVAGDTVVLTNAYFVGPADSNGITEIAIGLSPNL